MPQRLLQHKHCVTCGKAVPLTEEFCSEECDSSHSQVLGRKKRQLMFLWIGAIVVLIIAMLVGLG
ncbi:MAG: DUF2116 family Zn-ribbon domain-containing protein [Candidatus Thermoplasmatota archaeon]|nr:DUF2116 family Zn-ribbon domain-containing protein [Candidatus Thermoplasmatota archaeon]